ncbi:DUF6711 family protein [Paenibacillus sp. OV219]|uniref:DUF6711 family protein n=1 Tax=Paenibacillus sp. OV219 TaxID=1884377 RepID=UPI0008ABC943|nr:DUF6711 family protein [Paenibacillus sp. OV219]SEN19378.1 hypothetical protein SAMN05518847_102384 [Paenibacillus sp. OV219]
MATLYSINGVAQPTPSSFDVGIMMISKAERNAAGYMIIEKIATKRKLTINYAYLTPTQLSLLLQKLDVTSFSVTYLDPQTGGNRTASFYAGDRTVGMVSYIGGTPIYKDCKFDLIER